jgi:galactose mutarotase-like enzyme
VQQIELTAHRPHLLTMRQIDGGGKPGFDHCFAVDGYDASASQVDKTAAANNDDDGVPAKARFFATLRDPASGRAMDVWGTQPGVQVYTANWLNADGDEPEGSPHVQHGAVCLETEHYPNAINDPAAAAEVVLRPGKVYRHFTRHRFYVSE